MKLYLGAGKDRKEGFTHVDIFPFEGIDCVCDVCLGLPFADDSVDCVYTQDFMEHLPPEKKVFVINEIWRVLKPGGTMEHFIPNAGSRNDFGSPSHLSHWSLQQFEHFDINSYRNKKDKDYEKIVAIFEKVLAERVNFQEDELGKMAQSIHVIYKKVGKYD